LEVVLLAELRYFCRVLPPLAGAWRQNWGLILAWQKSAEVVNIFRVTGRRLVSLYTFSEPFNTSAGYTSPIPCSHPYSMSDKPAHRAQPDIVINNFTRLEKKQNKSGRWTWKCNYCGDDENSAGACIEGRDSRHILHLTSCSKAHESQKRLARKHLHLLKNGGTIDFSLASTSPENANPSPSTLNLDIPTVVSASTEVVRAVKKRKSTIGTFDGYVDRPMSEELKIAADVKFFRCVYIDFQSSLF
jgi:hypothetical protein